MMIRNWMDALYQAGAELDLEDDNGDGREEREENNTEENPPSPSPSCPLSTTGPTETSPQVLSGGFTFSSNSGHTPTSSSRPFIPKV